MFKYKSVEARSTRQKLSSAIRAALILFCFGLGAFGQITPDELLKEKVPAADFRLSYGTNELQFGELRLPKGQGPHPVAVLVHGGCWSARIGNLDPRATSLDLLRLMAAALTESRLATWNVEYRRLGNAGGGWPGTFHDLSKATDFLRVIAPKHGLDLKRVIVIGHSSGAQLAHWIAVRAKLPEASVLYSRNPLTFKGVVNLDGPIDLKEFEPFGQTICGGAVISQFLGGTPMEKPERYRESSGSSFLPSGVKQEIIMCSMMARLSEQMTRYENAATNKGDHVTITRIERAGHFGMLAPRSVEWNVVQERILSLVQ